jgi:hypothetical protein
MLIVHKKENAKRYYTRHAEQIKNKTRKYRQDNLKKVRSLDKKRYIKNREQKLMASKTYSLSTPERHEKKKYSSRSSSVKLHLSFEEYKKLKAKQGGVCQICGKTETVKHQSGTPRDLCIDHCHLTGTIRGLLCSECNMGLGKFKDNPVLLKKAYNYLLGRL